MDGTPDDLEFLVTSDHRVAVLNTLARGSSDRDALRSTTGASSPTMSRILTDFENRNWIERESRRYQLTGLGEFVAERLGEFVDAMTIEHQLRDVWQWLPHELDGFSVDLFTDVTVTHPNAGHPDKSTKRRIELITETSTWRGVGVAMLGLRTLETSFDRFLDQHDEFHCEYIYPPEVFDELLSWGDTETIMEAADSDGYTVLLHENLPMEDRYEISLFDDCVTICCYDHEKGGLQALVETTSSDMRTWAESYYGQFRAEAQPLRDAYERGSLRLLE
ncbi:helix-turn-helix transcriptional regulator [Natrarchaeobius oligotrophus]|uniref:Transcriptional regulator n=1 Tax=Natrarchaeobius chitinivorans TaxID=1679083 RepID=A0A3N6PF57_NATCH|nr:transcriptional regulator [Natrarchaeobius chitinivorans]RQG98589.1 transcriptional regulator [Natrarchaeobius chitinivorans]